MHYDWCLRRITPGVCVEWPPAVVEWPPKVINGPRGCLETRAGRGFPRGNCNCVLFANADVLLRRNRTTDNVGRGLGVALEDKTEGQRHWEAWARGWG